MPSLRIVLGDDGKWLAFHRHGKRLIPANIINVVDEAQVLENSRVFGVPRSQNALNPTGRVPVFG
jgi:hypothetical protein